MFLEPIFRQESISGLRIAVSTIDLKLSSNMWHKVEKSQRQ